MVKAKKHLGQHFLNNQDLASTIANAVSRDYPVVEIGPGTGVLTKELIKREFPFLRLVEKDEESCQFLRRNFKDLDLIQSDVLTESWDFFSGDMYSMVGNLPYNISSQIFFKVLENRETIKECVFMIQLEVGERILSPPGSKVYGILSVLIQLFFDTVKIRKVGPGNFNPPPKVDSIIIGLRRNDLVVSDKVFRNLLKIVKASFGQRRKKIKNALTSQFNDLFFLPTEFVSKRAEELRPDDFLCMAKEYSRN